MKYVSKNYKLNWKLLSHRPVSSCHQEIHCQEGWRCWQPVVSLQLGPEPCFNIKTIFQSVRIPIIKIIRSWGYLYNVNSYTSKTTSFYSDAVPIILAKSFDDHNNMKAGMQTFSACWSFVRRFTSNWWIIGGFPMQMATNRELWYLLCCQSESAAEMPTMWCHGSVWAWVSYGSGRWQ